MADHIVFFGGSFSPLTLAHIEIAKNIKKYLGDNTTIYFVPVNSGYNKSSVKEEIIKSSDRLELVKTVTNTDSHFKVFDYEINNDHIVKKFDSLQQLKKTTYASKNYYFVIGEDNILKLKKWYRYDDLISEYIPIVIIRYGGLSKDAILKIAPTSKIIETGEHVGKASSTDVRQLIKNNKIDEIKNHVSKDVFDIIKKKELYI